MTDKLTITSPEKIAQQTAAASEYDHEAALTLAEMLVQREERPKKLEDSFTCSAMPPTGDKGEQYLYEVLRYIAVRVTSTLRMESATNELHNAMIRGGVDTQTVDWCQYFNKVYTLAITMFGGAPVKSKCKSGMTAKQAMVERDLNKNQKFYRRIGATVNGLACETVEHWHNLDARRKHAIECGEEDSTFCGENSTVAQWGVDCAPALDPRLSDRLKASDPTQMSWLARFLKVADKTIHIPTADKLQEETLKQEANNAAKKLREQERRDTIKAGLQLLKDKEEQEKKVRDEADAAMFAADEAERTPVEFNRRTWETLDESEKRIIRRSWKAPYTGPGYSGGGGGGRGGKRGGAPRPPPLKEDFDEEEEDDDLLKSPVADPKAGSSAAAPLRKTVFSSDEDASDAEESEHGKATGEGDGSDANEALMRRLMLGGGGEDEGGDTEASGAVKTEVKLPPVASAPVLIDLTAEEEEVPLVAEDYTVEPESDNYELKLRCAPTKLIVAKKPAHRFKLDWMVEAFLNAVIGVDDAQETFLLQKITELMPESVQNYQLQVAYGQQFLITAGVLTVDGDGKAQPLAFTGPVNKWRTCRLLGHFVGTMMETTLAKQIFLPLFVRLYTGKKLHNKVFYYGRHFFKFKITDMTFNGRVISIVDAVPHGPQKGYFSWFHTIEFLSKFSCDECADK